MSKTQKVIQRLLDAGYTQVELQSITGIPQPRISRWANGQVTRIADDVVALVELADEVAPVKKKATRARK